MKKRRVSYRLEHNEALVVAPLEFWDQLQVHFEESAKEFPEEADGWLEAAEHVAKWVERSRDKRKAVGN